MKKYFYLIIWSFVKLYKNENIKLKSIQMTLYSPISSMLPLLIQTCYDRGCEQILIGCVTAASEGSPFCTALFY